MKRINRYGSELFTICFSLIFLSHFFVLERHRNGFVEYDRHFIAFYTLFIVLLYTVFAFFKDNVPVRLKFDLPFIFLFLFFLYTALDMTLTKRIDLTYINTFLLTLFIYQYLSNSSLHLATLVTCFVISNLFIVVLEIMDIHVLSTYYFAKNNRVMNTGENANYFASLIPFTFALFIKHVRKKKSLLKAVFCFCLLVMCGYAIYSFKARTAYCSIACGTGFVIFSTLNRQKVNQLFLKTRFRLLSYVPILLFSIAVVLVCILLFKENPGSIQGRLLIYDVCFNMIKEKPLLGHGPHGFDLYYNLFQSKMISDGSISLVSSLYADDSYFAFNDFIQITVEWGILGMFIVFGGIYFVWKGFRVNKNGNLYYLQIGAVASIISIAVSSQFSYPLQTKSILLNVLFYLFLISSGLKTPCSLSLNNKLYKLLLLCILFFTATISLAEFKILKALKTWELAAYDALISENNESLINYTRALPLLGQNGRFLYNYGANLYKMGDYRQSLYVLERATKYYSSTNLYLYLGDNYRILKKNKQAISCYRVAVAMHPARFLPKFKLLRLFQALGLKKDAVSMAREIVNFPIKIPSPKVNYYKKYAKEYLLKTAYNK